MQQGPGLLSSPRVVPMLSLGGNIHESARNLECLRALSSDMGSGRGAFDPMRLVGGEEDYFLSYARGVVPIDEGRRRFLKSLAIGVGAAAIAGAVPGLKYFSEPSVGGSGFKRMLLVDSSGKPITASNLQVNNEIITIYSYPLTNEINFLLNLGDSNNSPVQIAPTKVAVPLTGSSYDFPGGVGPHGSIVSYSAICQHLGCQPPNLHFFPPVRMVTGLPSPSDLDNQTLQVAKRANIPAFIYCACHGSAYDPYHGGAVLRLPTTKPLPAVVLEWDKATDYIYATGEVGVPVYGHTDNLSGGTAATGDNVPLNQTSSPFP